MHTYHVTYYYLASGMEGQADTADYGYVAAWSADDAICKVGYTRSPFEKNKAYREWGLSAKRVKTDYSKLHEL